MRIGYDGGDKRATWTDVIGPLGMSRRIEVFAASGLTASSNQWRSERVSCGILSNVCVGAVRAAK